jgi:hypothetical protein
MEIEFNFLFSKNQKFLLNKSQNVDHILCQLNLSHLLRLLVSSSLISLSHLLSYKYIPVYIYLWALQSVTNLGLCFTVC